MAALIRPERELTVPRGGLRGSNSLGHHLRFVALTCGSLLAITLVCVSGVLVYWSYPGQPTPFTDAHGQPLAGSLSERITVKINGVDQVMFIKSRDVKNPVLLFLHGGMTEYFLTQDFPTGLESAFTVVWWDRRGSGLSYSPNIRPETITSEQLISDTLAVTDYLRQRFGKDRIYLMAHSEGTFIGIQVAARAPQLYYAYVAVAQMSNQLESEILAYQYELQRFKENGNTTMVQKLEAAPVTAARGTPSDYLKIRDEAMHSLGIGTMHNMDSVLTGLFLRSLQFREYSIGDKITMWRAKAAAGTSYLWNQILATDLTKEVTRLEVPVYFLEGKYDYTANY